MSHKTGEKILLVAAVLMVAGTALFFLITKGQPPADLNQPIQNQPPTNNPPSQSEVEYINNEFGFSVALPDNWRGYKVDIDKWTGDAIGDQLGDTHYTDGPVVSIHSPQWTGPGSYQDIPIMVFTIAQWQDLQAGKFHIGAAPIGPSELARNPKYVFALPARYNFAYPPGTEEVQKIIDSSPLETFEPK
jgi:hypothetical protein